MRFSTPAVLLLGVSARVSYCQAYHDNTPAPTPAPAPPPPPVVVVENYNVACKGTSKEIVVNIKADTCLYETAWKVTDKCRSDEVIWSAGSYTLKHTDYSHSINVCDGQYDFTIMVSKVFV